MEINCMDDIPWSECMHEALLEYRHLGLMLIEEFNITFSQEHCNPVTLVNGYLLGKECNYDIQAVRDNLFDIINDEERKSGKRNINSERALKARLALSLLATPSDKNSLNESLDWLLLYLEKLGMDDDKSWTILHHFFEQKLSKRNVANNLLDG